MRSSSTDRRRQPRGVAFVEALLVLAVLTTLWLGVRSLTKLGQARLAVTTIARHCAWQMARSGCTELPPQCALEETPSASPAADSSLNEARQRAPSTTEPAVERRTRAEFDALPGSRVRATASRTVRARLLRGGDRALTTATISLPCAPRVSGPGNLAREVFDSLRGDP